MQALVKARDLKALQKFEMPRNCSTRIAIMRYRDLCITALKAKAA